MSEEARQVHQAALIVDLHADTPKLMSRGYDIYKRHSPPWPLSRYGGHVDVPRMRQGNLAAQFFAMWTFPLPERGCHADVNRQIDAIESAAAEGAAASAATGQGMRLRLCRTAAEIRAAHQDGALAALPGIEGGQALEGPTDAGDGPADDDKSATGGRVFPRSRPRSRPRAQPAELAHLARLAHFARRGVRYLGLLHFSKNALGFPAMGVGMDHSSGLTALGAQVVDGCAALGVMVDLAHINRRGFFDVVERQPGPLLVSHTGVAGVLRHWRNIDDQQVRAVADSGGVVGVIFAPRFLGQDGVLGVVAHLRHLINVGGEDVAALGSDWDGFVQPVRGLRSPAELPHLTEALLRGGMSVPAIHKLLGENVLRVLQAWEARRPGPG